MQSSPKPVTKKGFRLRNPVPGDITRLFQAVSYLMLAIAFTSAARTLFSFWGEETAEGRVLELSIHTGQAGKPFYSPVVEYFLADGTRQVAELGPASWPPAYTRGERVTVAYHRDRPEQARIRSGSNVLLLWILPIITGVLGGVFALAAIFAGWVLGPSPGPERKGKRPQSFP